MTEDFVVSCWPIPVKRRGQRDNDYFEQLQRIAYGIGEAVAIGSCSPKPCIEVGDKPLRAYAGDTVCQTVSGAYGVKRRK